MGKKILTEKEKKERSIKSKKYYQDHKEEIKAKNKAYKEANREKINKKKMVDYWKADREAEAIKAKLYREANKEKIAAKKKEYNEKNREELARKKKIYREKNKEEIARKGKIYRESTKDKRIAAKKKYYENNKEAKKEKARVYYQKHYKERLAARKEANPEIYAARKKKWNDENKDLIAERKKERRKNRTGFQKMKDRMRRVVVAALTYKEKRTLDYIGCSWIELESHLLENSPDDFVSLDQIGIGTFNVDHIIPISMVSIDELKNVNHFSNLQVLRAGDNNAKSNKVLSKDGKLLTCNYYDNKPDPDKTYLGNYSPDQLLLYLRRKTINISHINVK